MSTKKPTPLEERLSRVRATGQDDPRTAVTATVEAPDDTAAPAAADTPPARPAGGYRRRSVEPSYAERVPRATYYIDRSILEALDEVCRSHGFNKSEFVREAIVRHMAAVK